MTRKYCVAAPAVGENTGRTGRAAAFALTAIVLPLMAGCTTDQMTTGSIKPDADKSESLSGARHVAAVSADDKQRTCLVRAMYFESNRSSPDGLLAVGSVVMNRVKSQAFPDTICGVVGQRRQFAPGVMTRKMNSRTLPEIETIADAVVRGARHPKVGTAMFFHTAGMHFPYNNMHYVAVAGGNAFYEKTSRYAKNTQPAASHMITTVASVASPTVTATAADSGTVPLPSARPDDGGLPGVATAFVTPSGADARVQQAFASATN